MPFGLQGGAFSLTAALTKILEDYKFAQSYYDDILIFSESKEEHLEHLKKILGALAAYGMQVNKGKCQIMKEEVTFLGHRLSAAGLRPAQQKLGEIVNFPTPQRLEELKTFLGMAAFFRKFIPKFSQISADLYAMEKKGRTFEWTEECRAAFDKIKFELEHANTLTFPNFDEDFIMQVDASEKAIGYMLGQMREGELVPIMFGGRTLTSAETRYSTTDRELLACYFAVTKAKIYLVNQKFYLYTDHKPLTHLQSFKDILNKRYRWIYTLQEMGTVIRYIEGKDNIVADFLSRHSYEEAPLDVLHAAAVEFADNTGIDELRAGQNNDADIQEIKEFLKGKTKNFPTAYKKVKQRLLMEENL